MNAHSQWLGGACDESRTSHRECVKIKDFAYFGDVKKPHSSERGFFANCELRTANCESPTYFFFASTSHLSIWLPSRSSSVSTKCFLLAAR